MIHNKRAKKLALFISICILSILMISCAAYKDEASSEEPFTIEYSLTGGIAGFRDKATIKSNGEFVYKTGSKVVAEGNIDKEDMDKIRQYAVMDNNFKDKESTPKDSKVYPDKLETEISISFKGKVGTSKKSTEIIELIKKYREKLKK